MVICLSNRNQIKTCDKCFHPLRHFTGLFEHVTTYMTYYWNLKGEEKSSSAFYVPREIVSQSLTHGVTVSLGG